MLSLKYIKSRYFILSVMIVVFMILTGCEDVIDLNVNNAEPHLVIESYVLDDPPLAMAIISRSSNYFGNIEIPMVSGATVVISDDAGNADTLFEFQEGVYVNQYIRPEVGHTYTSTVTVDEVTYTASATLPEPLRIDSVSYEYQEGGGFGSEEDEGYILHVHFTDREDVEEFARFKITQNDSVWEEYYLYSDFYSDGNDIDFNYFYDVFQLGDTVEVEVYSMDETVYEYFEILSDVAIYEEGVEVEGEPGNPLTNWDNGALGYFGAFALEDRIYIVEDPDSL